MRYTPEEALVKILHNLRFHLQHETIYRIVPAGSVPLGTYVGEPDLDIFIEVKQKRGVMKGLQRAFPHGKEKKGELLIWHMPNMYGYPVDFVVVGRGEEKVQTLKHVDYFMQNLDDGARHRVRELKQLFKRINCYGAEVGGITGICLTRMAELFPSVEEAIQNMTLGLVASGKYMVEDPVLPGRNLFASVTSLKIKRMLQLFGEYGFDPPFIDSEYFYDEYQKIYRIRRKLKMGTDREFQFINSSIMKTWKQMNSRIKWWNPRLEYDLLFLPKDIIVGFSIYPDKLTEPGVEKIPYEKLNEKAIESLKKNKNAMLVYDDDEPTHFAYFREPPYKNVVSVFTENLIRRLMEVYIEVERA